MTTNGGELVGRFLDDCRRRNLRPGTITQKRNALRRLYRAVQPTPLLDVTYQQLVEFLDRLDQPESRATETSHLRSFYRWALLEQLIDIDPAARLIRPRVPRRLPRPMPSNDLAVALDTAPDRVRPWLVLAAYGGLRACEISGLRACDLMWDNQPPLLVVDQGKGGHARAVPMGPPVAAELAGHPRSGWLFPRRDGQPGPTPPHLISRLTNEHLHGLGITHTLHTLRHWFATETLRINGGDLRQTQELLGHQSPVSTAIYTWVDPKAAAATVAELPVLS